MRLKRAIVALSAMLAAMAATPGFPEHPGAKASSRQAIDSLARLLTSVAQFVPPAADPSAGPVAGNPHSFQAVLPLAASPLRHSLWLLASVTAVDLSERRGERLLLRC